MGEVRIIVDKVIVRTRKSKRRGPGIERSWHWGYSISLTQTDYVFSAWAATMTIDINIPDCAVLLVSLKDDCCGTLEAMSMFHALSNNTFAPSESPRESWRLESNGACDLTQERCCTPAIQVRRHPKPECL